MSSLAYPILLTKLAAQRCVVIGAGPVAERKVTGLLEVHADVLVISPTATPQLAALAASGDLQWAARPYQAGDLQGARLVFAATSNSQVNAAVLEEAAERGILANAADAPAASSFYNAAVVRSGPLLVTISTGGASPALAAWLRRRIDALLGPEVALLAEILEQLREQVRTLPEEQRAHLLRSLVCDEVLEWLRQGQHQKVESRIAMLWPDTPHV